MIFPCLANFSRFSRDEKESNVNCAKSLRGDDLNFLFALDTCPPCAVRKFVYRNSDTQQFGETQTKVKGSVEIFIFKEVLLKKN